MTSLQFEIAELLWAELPVHRPPGHEQHGYRPVIVLGIPEQIQAIPYRMLLVAPITRSRFQGPLFPLLTAGTGGLMADSTVLLYQLLAVDVHRIAGRLGKLQPAEYAPIYQSLRALIDWNHET